MAERILCVLGKLRNGGVESIMMSYYRFLDKEKYQYDFIYEDGSDSDFPEELLSMGARAFKVSSIGSPFRYMSEISAIIKREGYRIVHANLNTLSVFSLLSAKKCKVKCRILHNHTTSSPVERKRHLLKTMLRPLNLTVASDYCACSEKAGKWMYGEKRFNNGKVTVFNNGVDCRRFAYDSELRREIREELQLSDDICLVGHIGRFVSVKNHKFLVDAFCEAALSNEKLRLVLVGDGELFDDIRMYVKEKNITDKVIFTGVRADVEKLYSAFDIFVLPSLYEGLPVVAMEAAVSGLPIILSDSVTRECAVNDNVSFLPVDDKSAWASAMNCHYSSEREKYALDMENGPFNIVNCVKRLEDYYSKCL